MLKLFLGIFTRLKQIYWNIFTSVFLTWTVSARFGRSTLTVDRTMKPADCDGRPTCTDTCTLATCLVGRPDGRPTESSFALCLFGSTGRSTGSANGSKYDRWAVDRTVDWQGNSGNICCQRLVSRFAYIYPIWKSFSLRIFGLKFSFSQVFLLQSK